MRIYIGNVEIAGYFTKLRDGFEKEGIRADLWFLSKNKYYQNRMPFLVSVNQWLFDRFKKGGSSLNRWLTLPFLLLTKAVIFVWVLARYDVFILNSHAYFNFHELAVLKYFRKKIIFVCLGTESRPLYMSGNSILTKYVNEGHLKYNVCYEDVKRQKEEIERIERYADIMINHPPTALFHSKPFIAWMHIGFPSGNGEGAALNSNERSRLVKILHAPSLALSKGSAEIEAMVNNLKEQGYPVEFVRLENVPNHKVLETIREVDIVVDELYADIPLGGLGTEAAVAHKPVLSAGYYSGCMHSDYPAEVIPPSVFCQPEFLEQELLSLVVDRNKRFEIGEASAQFVKNNWNNREVARKFMCLINGDIPANWYFEPEKINCIHGYGMQEDKLKKFIFGYIEKYGAEALFLEHNPVLKSKVLDFVHEKRFVLSERKVS